MPCWIGESKVHEGESNMAADGAPPRDLSSYSEWRRDAEPHVLWVFEFYAIYLAGQTAGLSDALSLEAIRTAFLIERVPRDRWADLIIDLRIVHAAVIRRQQKEQASSGGNDRSRQPHHRPQRSR